MKELSRFARSLSRGAQDNSPVILTAVGVTGICATAVLTARAAYRVGKDVNAGHYEPIMEGQAPEVYDFKTLVQTYWKEFVPPAGVGLITILAVIGSNRVSTSRAVALATAYSISEQTFDSYRKKVIERIGEEQDQLVRAEVAQEKIDKHEGMSVFISDGKHLCYDEFTDRYFESTVEDIKKAQNDTNYQMLHEGYASLSDFYQRVGLPATSMSEEVGWTSDKQLEVAISSILAPSGKPAVSIGFHVRPVRDYWKMSR